MPFDYSKLNGLITEKCNSRAVFARKIGLSERSVSLKMNGKLQWKQEEICNVCNVLSIVKEDIPIYFLCQKFKKFEHSVS